MKILRKVPLLLVLGFLFGSAGFAQVIASVTPSAVTTGTSLTINGSGFGTSQGLSNTITFAGVPSLPRVMATSWSSTRIVVTVPQSAVSGNVAVTVAGHASNGVSLTVTPQVSSVTPASAVAGTAVTINGSGFGNSAPVGSSTVSFNGIAAATTSWSSTTIVAVVPNGATAGPVVVTVAGQASSSGAFTPTPVTSGLTPGQGASGTTVTIAGSSFGDAQGSSVVTFNGVTAPITAWSNTSVTAVVPNSTSTGPVVVAVNGVAGNGVNFTVTPGISGITPNPGLAGSAVVISGSNFGATQGASTSTFNGVSAAVMSWSNTSITATVPNNVVAGPVVVTVNGYASNGVQWALTPSYSYSVNYAANGNVLGAQDSVNGNWSYSYDDFNRLATANNSTLQQGYGYRYDRYGNRWQQNLTAGTGNVSQLTFSGGPATSNGNCYHAAGQTNQPDGYCYDAAGNLLNDGQHSYTYDAENRIVAVDGGQGAKYVYDGDGLRIEKTSAAGTSEYVYDLSGRVITEVNSSGAWTRSEIYAGGRHLGTYRDGTLYFIQADWLGTERMRVLPTGDPYEICSSLPFGDGLKCTGASDPSPNHLTGKPRDLETGLDYFGARYYSNALGRWITPDWSEVPVPVPYADLADPQSLNQYTFVRNIPTTNVDEMGHWPTLVSPPKTPTMEQLEQIGRMMQEGAKQGAKMIARRALWVSAGRVTVGTAILMGLAMTFPEALPGGKVGQSNADARAAIEQASRERAAQNDGVDPQRACNEPELAPASGGAMRGNGRGLDLSGIVRNANRGIDFSTSQYLKQDLATGQKNTVDIQYTGSRKADFAAANKAAGYTTTPKGYTWHHVDNYNATTNTGTMQLVQTDAHQAISHYGGVRQYEQATGTSYRP